MLSILKKVTLSPVKSAWLMARSFFWLGPWLYGLGVLLSFLLRWGPGDRLVVVRLTHYLMPWLLIGLIPGLILARLARRRRLLALLVAPALFIGLTYAPLFLPWPTFALADGIPIKVMSYNVLRENIKMNAVAGLIRQEQPDILLRQELKPFQAHALRERLLDLYPDAELQLAYEPDILQAVISRYPLTPLGALPKKGLAQKVRVETPGGPITVWNVHPPSGQGWRRRHRQISALLIEEVRPTAGPQIVGGDFNTTDNTETYRLLSSYLRNSHREAGWGFGFTFPASVAAAGDGISLPPLIRIDHIFHSDHFFARRARTLNEAGGSDHFPVVAELWLVQPR